MKLSSCIGLLALVITACSGARQEPSGPAPAGSHDATPAPGASPLASPAEGVLSSKESKAVARTLARVSELRGVKSTRPVPGVKLERDKLVARVKEKALREYPADALRREGQLLQLFGFAPASFDYLGEMMTLLEAQLEGFYEPKNGTMYLAADLRGKEAQATLAHELVHALQDQTWDLKGRSSYRPGKGDETLALACLAEGDATSLMMDYVLQEQDRTALDLPEEMLRELMQNGVNGASIKNVPHILRATLIAPYVDGLGFVHALRRKGGWPLVDRAWTQLPTTTEQVLHVEKWEAHEAALNVPPPSGQALGAAFKRVDEDTFGELGLALTFEEWLDGPEARVAASDWGGDRSAVYTTSDEIALAIHVRYDDAKPRSDAYARRALTKLQAGLKKPLGKPTIESADAICFERKDTGAFLIARRDREIVMTAGPARMAQGSWTSTSTCAQAKRWADEIAAQP